MSSTTWLLLAMALHPSIQHKAQAELDSVVGPDRLPTWADRSALPYVHVVLKEVLRWKPVVPIAAPHRTMVDDEYRGFFIPAGTIVVTNSWCAVLSRLVFLCA